MDIQQLRCVMEVMRQGSFTKAAQKLYISQPHLSQQVQKLESELGITVFTRTTHSLILTEAGAEFLRCAQEVLDAWDRLESSCKIMSGTLIIGILDRFKVINLPGIIRRFHSLHPNLNIKVNTYLENDLQRQLNNDRLDIAFLRQSMLEPYIQNPAFKCELFLEDALHVLMSPTNPLTQFSAISAEQLKGFKIVAGKKGSSTYATICETLQFSKPEEHFLPVVTDSHDVMAELVREGDSVTLGNKSVGEYYGLASIPYTPPLHNNAYMVYLAKRKVTPALAAFINFIIEIYSGDDWKSNLQYPQRSS